MCKYDMILGQNNVAHFDYKANGNMMVLGQVGTYKTRGHVLPNIMHQNDISMVISDTKGELQAKTESLLARKGYIIKSVNFDIPTLSKNQFNPFAYIKTPEDILAVSSIIVSELHLGNNHDPYWDNASLLLINAVIAFMLEECRPSEQTLANLRKLICAFKVYNEGSENKSALEIMFGDLKKRKPNSYAVKQWEAFATIGGVEKTASCIVSTLLSKFAQFLTPDIEQLTEKDTLNLNALGFKKTALFISVSDVDRSKDKLASIFYCLLLNRLRVLADEQEDKGLPVHVHCFLDDFATNVVIPGFDNYISCLRSREISFTLVLQSEAQLEKLYGQSAKTIVANCAYYLFLGSRDLDGCYDISKRMNVPLDRILYKDRDEVFILSGFQRPIVDKIYDICTHPDYDKLECERKYPVTPDICR